MKYNYFSIRINVTKYDVTFATKGGSNPQTSVHRIRWIETPADVNRLTTETRSF